MLLALALAAIPVIILFLLGGSKKYADTSLKIITIAGLIIVFAQIIIGTEVREQIDVISKNYNYENRSLWIAGLNYFFNIHRIMAFAAALCCIFIS